YEKDDNLAFSLYECLLDKLIKDSKQKKDYIKTARDLLIGGLKGVNSGNDLLICKFTLAILFNS
ncbi:unnamed protein product, partial [marine sediment metagenome]